MAKMKLTREKELLIGLIVSDDFIRQISPVLQTTYLQASSSKIIARWCLEYYDEYNKAPDMVIKEIYNENKKNLDEEDALLIAKTLAHISDTYEEKEKYNIPYMIDRANNYIRERRLTMLQDQLEHDVTLGRLDKAENAIVSFNKLSKTTVEETDLWKDQNAVANIFNTESYKLFRMPKALGQLQGYYRRDNLYSYAGVAKRGKSRWLAQTAMIASMTKLNVLYLSLEMSKEETDDLLINTVARTLNDKDIGEAEVEIPRFTEENTVVYDTVIMKSPSESDYKKWQRKLSILCGSLQVVIGEPNKMTLDDIDDTLLSLEYHKGFTPDVICVDYADIISGKGYDSRDRVNNIWVGLKSLAKKYHCAVITATHMNSEALKKDGEDYNIGEDRRKLNHVSGMYILNQTPEEKKAHIMRVKATATRFGEYTSLDEVVVLYNFSAGRTYIDCRWKHEMPEYNE